MFILKEPKWGCQKENSVCRLHNRKLFQNKMYSLLCCNISATAKRNDSVVLKQILLIFHFSIGCLLVLFPPQNQKNISV